METTICTLCGGFGGSFNTTGAHIRCAVLAKHGEPTPRIEVAPVDFSEDLIAIAKRGVFALR
jgi:hypothetical protein|tara:strand:+ start:381 stop:566 length:186 start_codon:yes stop_codon:yes gene_type:complete